MNKYQLIEKQVQTETTEVHFQKEYDVVVVGLGTAGAVALIQAARLGLRVLGIETLNCMGGIGTAGGIHNYYLGSKGGIQQEIDDRCAALADKYNIHGGGDFHPDGKKYVLEQMAIEAGAEYYYESCVTACFANDRQVTGVECLTIDGFQTIACQFVIDASGDAHVAAMLGCPARFGRETDSYPQPYSFIRGTLRSNNSLFGNNFDSGYVDPRDPEDMSYATVYSNSLHCFDEFTEKNKLTTLYPQIGLREGRFIIGEDTISFEDVVNERVRPDNVAQTYSRYDNHATDQAFESVAAQEYGIAADLFARGQVVETPPGIFIPKDWHGILIAGRCVSLDHDSHMGIRMQPDMQKFGEITAYMAHQAIKTQAQAKDLDVCLLQEQLAASGCLQTGDKELQHLPWLTNLFAIKQAFREKRAGVALWSCRRLGPSIADTLWQWTQEQNDNVKRHASIALGLLRDQRAIPLLEQLASEQVYEPTLQNYALRIDRRYAPLIELRVFAAESSIPVFTDVLYRIKNEAVTVSYCIVGLLAIGEQHPQHRSTIIQCIADYLQQETSHLLALARNPENPAEMNPFYRRHLKQRAEAWGIPLELELSTETRSLSL